MKETQDLSSFEMLRYPGVMKMEEIKKFTKNEDWIAFRATLRGTSLAYKYDALYEWLRTHQFDHPSRVQVGNYVNAVSRGGQLKKS